MNGNNRMKSRLRQPHWLNEAILIGLPITCIFMVALIIFVITMEPSVSGVNHQWPDNGDNLFDKKAKRVAELETMQQQQQYVKPNVHNVVDRAKRVLNVPFEKLDGLQPISRTAPNSYGLVLDRPASEQAPGEQGRGIEVDQQSLSPEEIVKYETGWKKHHFNQYASDQISVQRRIRDMRSSECWNKRYPDNLPDTSVIICFHNEALSTLLRTVYSLLNRSPGRLLREIILVDDFSSYDELKRPLEAYVASLSKVKLLRAPERLGLIRARLMGYKVATGKVLTFMDSHCECSPGWLEPLLAPIAENSSMVTSPIIDPISEQTFEYQGAVGGARVQPMIGIFDWQLLFHWAPITLDGQLRRKSPTDLIRSPAMPGGIFSIDRQFFTKLGTYDPGMDIWGGENIEMSLRVWMCGGSIATSPCSRVGHVFRDSSPYDFQGVDVIKKNSVRLAEVWLDDYKVYYYDRIHYALGNYGDVSDRRALRSRLKCNTFQWYLDNIFPEMYVPFKAQASGSIVAVSADACLSASTDLSQPGLAPCTNIEDQYWVLSEKGEIRRDQHCFIAAESQHETLYVTSCYSASGNLGWEYRQDNTIFHNKTGRCLQFSEKSKAVQMAPCSGGDNQVWKWSRKSPKQKTKDDFDLADPK